MSYVYASLNKRIPLYALNNLFKGQLIVLFKRNKGQALNKISEWHANEV